MKERPILFSAPMVLALLDGRKTQTRRPYKNRRHPDFGCDIAASELVREQQHIIDRICPYGQPGDLLWVREAFSGPYCMEAAEGRAAVPPSKWWCTSSLWFWADGDPQEGDWTKPRPSIHMPRWASRINLIITGVRVERLQEINEADAMAEGIACENVIVDCSCHGGSHVEVSADRYFFDGCQEEGFESAADAYAALWESINGPGSWNANPWVWVIEFKKVAAA